MTMYDAAFSHRFKNVRLLFHRPCRLGQFQTMEETVALHLTVLLHHLTL